MASKHKQPEGKKVEEDRYKGMVPPEVRLIAEGSNRVTALKGHLSSYQLKFVRKTQSG